MLEKPEYLSALESGLQYLILLSTIEDKEIFKICLEYWNELTGSLYNEKCVLFLLLSFPCLVPAFAPLFLCVPL